MNRVWNAPSRVRRRVAYGISTWSISQISVSRPPIAVAQQNVR